MIVYLLLLIPFFLLFYFQRKSYYWKKKDVPFDPPFLFFGSFFNLVIQKETMCERLHAVYNQHDGPYVGFHIFTVPFLMLRDPKFIKTVLIKDFDKFMNRGSGTNERVDPIAYHSLLSAEGQTWRSLRPKLTPIFSAGKIKLMFPMMENCAKNMTRYLTSHDGQVIDGENLTRKYSVDVISSCAFGVDGNCWLDEDSDMLQNATNLVNMTSLKRSVSIFSYFFIPFFVNVFKLTLFDHKATKFFIDVFQKSMKTREELKLVRNDFIDLLNNLRKSDQLIDSYQFDSVKIAAQAIFFFAAGNDTSTLTLTFALYELALHKDIQNELRKEVRGILQIENKSLNYDNIQEMKYLDMVISETLRKHPIIHFTNRKSMEKYTFEDTNLTLEKNVDILVPIFALHHDPGYFPEPEKFIPERFSEENKNNIKPYTYLPFGEGPRNCIGQRFALLSIKLGLAYIIKDFTVELFNEASFSFKYDAKSFALQCKDCIRFKITKI